MNFYRLILFLFLSLVLSCGKTEFPADNPTPSVPADEKPEPGKYILPLIETTDMHGYIVSVSASAVHYRLAYIADKVRDVRGHGASYDKDRLLLLDGGDIYQGGSVSNMLAGRPMYIAMDMMDYDAVTLGNHEFDWTIEELVDSDATLPDYEIGGKSYDNQIPVLCANLYRNGDRVPFTKDCVIVEKSAVNADGITARVKIGIVGFAEDYASSIMTSKFTDKGYDIWETYSLANTIAADLESSGQCDATILLTHGDAGDAASKLGSGTAFDLVLGGHTHKYFSGTTSWGLPYLQGGRYCEHFGYAELRFVVDDQRNLSFVGVGNTRTPAVDATRDLHTSEGQNADDLSADVLALSEDAVEEISAALNDEIGYIGIGATTYYIDGSGSRAATISNWMCDIIRRIGEADVAFVNSGGIRTSFPMEGQYRRGITVANVYEMFPFSNAIYVYDISYADLLAVMEYSMTSGGQGLFSRMTGIECRYARRNSGYEVLSLSKDGTVIYADKAWTGDWASRKLKLAASEYLATSQRTDYYTGISNPLVAWNGTSRLVRNDQVDNEGAVSVLRAEASVSGGHLYIDAKPYFILEE